MTSTPTLTDPPTTTTTTSTDVAQSLEPIPTTNPGFPSQLNGDDNATTTTKGARAISHHDNSLQELTDAYHEDLIPRVSVEVLVAEGRRQQTIGMGGNRGALVHLVDKRILRYRVYKEYIAPRRVSQNEISFISACYQRHSQQQPQQQQQPLKQGTSSCRHDNEEKEEQHEDAPKDGDAIEQGPPSREAFSSSSPLRFNTAQQTLSTHLVIPDALVVEGSNEGRGVLMPLFHGNLFQVLSTVQRLPPPPLRLDSTAIDDDDDSYCSPNVFRSKAEFTPIADPQVIAALLYQITVGVVTLNYELPHVGPTGEQHTGFSHNDLHLANILIHYDTGTVVLCDFELVEHLPQPRGRDPPCERIPCRSRHPPFGLWREPSDVWGLGLLAVDLLTGIVPIVDADNAFDDFGEGPLLELPSAADMLPVIDWEGNLGEHVAACRGVPSGSCPMTDGLYDFCRQCLSNTEELERTEGWARSKELLDASCFRAFRKGTVDARAVVKEYFDQFEEGRPAVVMGRAADHTKNSPLVISTPVMECL